jgi:DNA polymerase III alpha subunit
MTKEQKQYAIRFGLGAIKAVGLKMMDNLVKIREKEGEFNDIYQFCQRVDPKSINKKSIEALAKSGSFDNIEPNRRKIAESFEILSNYSSQIKEENESSQMSLFNNDQDYNAKPDLKNIDNWNKVDKLKSEFEAFGFFLNEHPIDDYLDELKKRGVISSIRIDEEDIEDNSLVKIAGVVCSSKHRSGLKGRFAYISISDPCGIFEAMIFDEALINASRDLLEDATLVVIECLIKKDDGGTRIITRNITALESFLKNTEKKDQYFEDITKIKSRKNYKSKNEELSKNEVENNITEIKQNIITKIEIIIKDRNPISSLKAFLSQRQAFSEDKTTTVIITVLSNNKFSKIELIKKYLIDANDVNKIKQINSIIDVENF